MYLGVSCYVRTDGRVDVMAQSNDEGLCIVSFFDEYPLQSYKHDQYLIWRDYVQCLYDDIENQAQRQRNYKYLDRFNFYNKLIDEFYKKRR